VEGIKDSKRIESACGMAWHVRECLPSEHGKGNCFVCVRVLCVCLRRSLGNAYQFVKGTRSDQKKKNGLGSRFEAFEELVSILRGHDTRGKNCGAGFARMDANELEEEVQRVEKTAGRLREELRARQKEIHEQVAACVQDVHMLQVQGVASLEELPGEVKITIQNRNVMREKHYKDLRSASWDLLQV
jgi:hypothetical protein